MVVGGRSVVTRRERDLAEPVQGGGLAAAVAGLAVPGQRLLVVGACLLVLAEATMRGAEPFEHLGDAVPVVEPVVDPKRLVVHRERLLEVPEPGRRATGCAQHRSLRGSVAQLPVEPQGTQVVVAGWIGLFLAQAHMAKTLLGPGDDVPVAELVAEPKSLPMLVSGLVIAALTPVDPAHVDEGAAFGRPVSSGPAGLQRVRVEGGRVRVVGAVVEVAVQCRGLMADRSPGRRPQ